MTFIKQSFAVIALLFALALPAFADESNRGLFEGSLAGGGKAVFFVQGNHSVSAYFFDAATKTASFAGGAIKDDGTFSLTTNKGVTVNGQLSSNSITLTFNGQNVTLNRVDPFGNTSLIAGRFNGSGTSSSGATLDNIKIIVDSQGNIFFLGKSGGNFIGGFGTLTITQTTTGGSDEHDGDDDDDRDENRTEDNQFSQTVTATFTITGLNGETISGTLTFSHGAISGTITINGTTFNINVDRESAFNRLANISTRGFVNTGQGQLIGGFIIRGGPKMVLIRALGPSLSSKGVSPVLANPKLQLFQTGQTTPLKENDDWQSASNSGDVQKTNIAPTDSKESALLVRLEPGAYTTVVSGADNGTGIALVEVYEIDND